MENEVARSRIAMTSNQAFFVSTRGRGALMFEALEAIDMRAACAYGTLCFGPAHRAVILHLLLGPFFCYLVPEYS